MYVPTADCPNCLGSGQCWVCLGNGLLDRPGATVPIDRCHRCMGTGKCRDCGVVTVRDMQDPPPILERRGPKRRRLRAIRNDTMSAGD